MKQKNPLWIAGALGTLLSSLGIVEGRDVPSEQIPTIGKKMVGYVETRKGPGEGKIPEKSPEYEFIQNLANIFQVILESTKTEKEKAIGLKEIIRGKKTEYEVMIRSSCLGFQDKNDFHDIVQGLIEVAQGAATTLEKTVNPPRQVVEATTQKVADATAITPAQARPKGLPTPEAKTEPKMENTAGFPPIPFPVMHSREVDLGEINLALDVWKRSPTEAGIRELREKTIAVALLTPDILSELSGENGNSAKNAWKAILQTQKSLSGLIEKYQNIYELYQRAGGKLQEHLSNLRKADILGIGIPEIDEAEGVVSNFEIAEKNILDMGITINRDISDAVRELMGLLTKAVAIQASWRNTIQDVASSLYDSSAEFDRATAEFLTHPNSHIDKLIDTHFPQRSEFIGKVTDFYNTVNSGPINEEDRDTIIARIDELKKKNNHSELSPIFDSLNGSVRLSARPEPGVSTVPIAGLMILLTSLGGILLGLSSKKRKGTLKAVNRIEEGSLLAKKFDEIRVMRYEELVKLDDQIEEFRENDLLGDRAAGIVDAVVSYLIAVAKSTDSQIAGGAFQDFAWSMLNNTDVSDESFKLLAEHYPKNEVNAQIRLCRKCVQRFNAGSMNGSI